MKDFSMYTTIKGRYENGKVILQDEPPVQEGEVLVIFQDAKTASKKNRQFGSGRGTLVFMADDFDEPLEDFKDYM